MFWRTILSAMFLWCEAIQAMSFPPFPRLENWTEGLAGMHGRASFKGEVIASTCTLSMEDPYQAIDIGISPTRNFYGRFASSEKKLRMWLHNCELTGTVKRIYTASYVRMTFDWEWKRAQDKFPCVGQAEKPYFQIWDIHGYPVRAGVIMSPLLMNGNENELYYILRVVHYGEPLKDGDCNATLRFNVMYE